MKKTERFCFVFFDYWVIITLGENMIEICFVCTGGTCRSFMAERIARKMAKDRKMKNIKFSSVGIFSKGEVSAKNACDALKKLGYDGRKKKSSPLKKIKPNCLYVTVTNDYKRFINSKKIISFEDLAGKVIDPYQQDLEIYEKCAGLIEQNVEMLLNKIENLRG